MALTNVTSAADFDALCASSPFTVAHYWASWCDPCNAMDQLMKEMAVTRPNVRFIRIEAEEVDDLAERYDVSAVPYFTFHHKGNLVDKLEGADGKALASKVQEHFGVAVAAPPAAAAAAVPAPVDINARLKQLTTQAPVVLFMKGTKAGTTQRHTREPLLLHKSLILFSTPPTNNSSSLSFFFQHFLLPRHLRKTTNHHALLTP
jgi:thiol-disulfide isomerase/thioredoxin